MSLIACCVLHARAEARPDQSHPLSLALISSSHTTAGGGIGIPGLYVTEDPGAVDKAAQTGNLSIRIGLGWAKSISFATGQCPVMKYHHYLAKAIMNDKVHVAKAVNATVISIDDAPKVRTSGGGSVDACLCERGHQLMYFSRMPHTPS